MFCTHTNSRSYYRQAPTVTMFANLARIPARNPLSKAHQPDHNSKPTIRLFSLSKRPKQSMCDFDAENDESRPSLLDSRSLIHLSGGCLGTPGTSKNRDTQEFRNISRPHTATDTRGRRRVTTVSVPGSRLTSEVIAQISAAVLRQHRAFNNLSPESRACLPLHLHRIRSILDFEPADDMDLNSVMRLRNLDLNPVPELRNTEIPIILTTFHTGTEVTQSTAPAKADISPTSETQLSEYSWLDLEASNGQDKPNASPAPHVGGGRRPPGDTSWLGDWASSPRPLLPARVVSKRPLANTGAMRPSLPIAAGFASGNGTDFRTNIETTNAERPKSSFRVFPRNAVPARPPQPQPQVIPVADRYGRVSDWLHSVAPGRSGETPSTSESGRTRSLENTSTANTTQRSRQHAAQGQNSQHPVERTGPCARTSNAYPAATASRTQPHSQTRFFRPHPRLSTILDVSPPQDQGAQPQAQPVRYRRRR